MLRLGWKDRNNEMNLYERLVLFDFIFEYFFRIGLINN